MTRNTLRYHFTDPVLCLKAEDHISSAAPGILINSCEASIGRYLFVESGLPDSLHTWIVTNGGVLNATPTDK